MGLGIAGALGIASAVGQMITNKSNQKWQTRMSNTAHQREVADLKAAGLNPILSAGGSGASTPNFQAINPVDTGISSYNTAKLVKAQVQDLNSKAKLQSAQEQNVYEQTKLVIQQTETEKARGRLTQLQGDKTIQETLKIKKEADELLPATIRKIEQDIRTGKATEEERRALAMYHIVGAECAQMNVQIALYNAKTNRMSVEQQGRLIIGQLANLSMDTAIKGQAYKFNELYPTGYVYHQSGNVKAGNSAFGISVGKSDGVVGPFYR